MTESPVFTSPSAESRRLMAWLSKRGAPLPKAHGVQLWLWRRMMSTIGRLGRGARCRTVHYGVKGMLTGTASDGGILMWVHGGGFVSGTPRLQRNLAAAYAEPLGIPAFLPRYRLAPEHPFPAAADDLLAAYRALVDRFPPGSIRLGGDSSGGFLAAALLGDIARAGLPMPKSVVLLSPLLNLDVTTARRRHAVTPDPLEPLAFMAESNKAYAGGTPFEHPRLAVLAADMTGWPPVLVQMSDLECVADDALAFGAALREAGGSCEVQLWPGQVHVFPAWGANRIPEAAAAIAYGSAFLA